MDHYRQANLRRAALDPAEVDKQVTELLLRVADEDVEAVGAADHAGVADLTTTLAVKWRLVQHDGDLGTQMG